MKVITLLSGIPGSGKSTWIKNQGLQDYVLSTDQIRMNLFGPAYRLEKSKEFPNDIAQMQVLPATSAINDQKVFDLLYKMIHLRMSKGSYIIVDAQNISNPSQKEIKKIAQLYNYRVNLVDVQGDLSLDQLHYQNLQRYGTPSFVPTSVIDQRYHKRKHRLNQHGKLTIAGIQQLSTAEFNDSLIWRSSDLNDYKKINVIGDIHGCYDVLRQAIPEIKDDEFYIFVGDYFDRGIQNDLVFLFLMEIKDRQNVVLLQGNHENHLFNFVNRSKKEPVTIPKQFMKKTLPQLLRHPEINEKQFARLTRAIQTVFAFSYNDKEYFVNHGGVTPEMLHIHQRGQYKVIPVQNSYFTHGIGNYDFDVDDYFNEKLPNLLLTYDLVQIHGHRNTFHHYDVTNSIALEDNVELGGHLCVLEISKDTTDYKRYKNDVYDAELAVDSHLAIDLNRLTQLEVQKHLSLSKNIKKAPVGKKYTAYNFNRDAFLNDHWNSFTLTARGLILDNHTGKIHARGYNKFFNLNQNEQTKWENIQETMVYPVKAAEKLNGYLGLLTSDGSKLCFYTKSGLTPQSHMFQRLFYDQLKAKHLERLIPLLVKILHEHNVTCTFEVIDIQRDPHIVQYTKNQLVLLDVLQNNYKLTFVDDVKHTLVELFDFITPSETWLNNQQELEHFIDTAANESNSEGYVFKDQNNFMFKLKNKEYNELKYIRTIMHTIIGKGINTYDEYIAHRRPTQAHLDESFAKLYGAGLVKPNFHMYDVRNVLITDD